MRVRCISVAEQQPARRRETSLRRPLRWQFTACRGLTVHAWFYHGCAVRSRPHLCQRYRPAPHRGSFCFARRKPDPLRGVVFCDVRARLRLARDRARLLVNHIWAQWRESRVARRLAVGSCGPGNRHRRFGGAGGGRGWERRRLDLGDCRRLGVVGGWGRCGWRRGRRGLQGAGGLGPAGLALLSRAWWRLHVPWRELMWRALEVQRLVMLRSNRYTQAR